MENCVFIGTKIEKETAENLGKLIEMAFKAGKENGMDQSTIVEALKIIKEIAPPEGVNISNSTFTGEKIINVDTGEES